MYRTRRYAKPVLRFLVPFFFSAQGGYTKVLPPNNRTPLKLGGNDSIIDGGTVTPDQGEGKNSGWNRTRLEGWDGLILTLPGFCRVRYLPSQRVSPSLERPLSKTRKKTKGGQIITKYKTRENYLGFAPLDRHPFAL